MIDKTSDQFKRGMKEEMHEHPHIPKKTIEELVTNHLTLHPYMYQK